MNESEKDNQAELQPQLRFKGFTQPWEQRQLRDIYHPSKERNDPIQFNGDRIISVANMHFAPKSMRKDYLKTYNIFRVGDIAFEGHKNDSFEFGRFVENDIGDGIVSHVFSVYRPNDHSQDIQFWKYLIHNETVMRNVLRFSTISATMMRNLVPADFEKRSIAVPSSSEQKQIGTFLKTLDSLISAAKRKETLLELKKQAYLQQMFPQNGERQPQLRFPGFTGEWEQRKLGDYLQISSERNNKEIFDKHSVLSVSRLYGVLNQIDLLGRSFAGSNLLGYKVVHPNDVIYTKSPLKQNPYGIIEMTKVTGIVSPLYAVYRPLKNVDSYFIHTYFALDTRLNNYLIPLVTKGAKNTLNVSDSEVLEGHVIFPHLKEQTALSEFFQRLDSLIEAAKRQRDLLKDQKQAYLQLMFPKNGQDSDSLSSLMIGNDDGLEISLNRLKQRIQVHQSKRH